MKITNRVAAGLMAAAAVAAGLGAPAAVSSSARAADLTITVTGVKHARGRLYIAVHRAGAGIKFPSDKGMVAGLWREAAKGSFTVTITGLPPGRYAVNGFHDLNGNGKLDTNMLGVPTEGYGFGNGATGSFGPPGFKAASVAVSGKASITLPFGY